MIFEKSDSADNPVEAFAALLMEVAAARQRGAPEISARCLDAAARLHPVDPAARYALLPRLLGHGRSNDALALAQANVQLDPLDAKAIFGLGYVLQMTARHAEAVSVYQRAYALEPDLRGLRKNLATAAHLSGHTSEAVLPFLEEAAGIDPSDCALWIDLSYHYRRAFRLDAALAAGRRALEIAPRNVVALINHYATLMDACRWDEARTVIEKAYALQPGNQTCRAALATHKLMNGDYDEGWRGHEFRWQGKGSNELAIRRPVFPCPTWRGRSLAGMTLYLWGEQGLGDVLQFCRYVRLLAQRAHEDGGKLVWNCFPALASLLQRGPGQYVDQFVSGPWDAAVHADYEVPLLSLPLHFNTREETIPLDIPYLFADRDAAAVWRERLAGEKRLKVGLAWKGSLIHNRNRFRSVGLARLASHFSALQHHVAFFSLQPDANDDVAAARSAGFAIADYTNELSTYDDTAALVESLDLVISVCTSIAHLGGAMGKRTWVLLDACPHWVWQLDRTDSPWYPATTLYRQRTFAQWEPVLDRVVRDLRDLATDHASAVEADIA